MNFLSQQFTLSIYYTMFKTLFNIIGFDYYKGLNNKLPPIRYIGVDESNNEIVSLAHPRDFIKHIKILKNTYKTSKLAQTINDQNQPTQPTQPTQPIHQIQYNLDQIKDDILEIYPSTSELSTNPNGFIGLFVNDIGISILMEEFKSNNEISNLKFVKVENNGINIIDIELVGVIQTFIEKFNTKQHLITRYKDLYLVIGEQKEIDIITGITTSTNKYNIIGGKRTLYENSIEATIRESMEEFGLDKQNSKIYKLINELVPKTKDIIRCTSFNVYCIYITPKPKSTIEYQNKQNIKQIIDLINN